MTDHAELTIDAPKLAIEPTATKAELQAEASARFCDTSRLEGEIAFLKDRVAALEARINLPRPLFSSDDLGAPISSAADYGVMQWENLGASAFSGLQE